MKHRPRHRCPLPFLLTLLSATASHAQAPTPAALAAFATYTDALERRLSQEHHSPQTFISIIDLNPEAARLRTGELLLEEPAADITGPGFALHDWRGTAFVPGAQTADFEALLRNAAAYPRVFAPQVLGASALPQTADHLQLTMRLRQHHGLTVVMDTAYDVTFARLDAQHAWSTSRSTAITELDAPGTPRERPLRPDQAHGFLWRMNTYWTFEEEDGGLYLQLESVSLTRNIPAGLHWLVGPYIESIPRDSLTFTLHAVCNALRR